MKIFLWIAVIFINSTPTLAWTQLAQSIEVRGNIGILNPENTVADRRVVGTQMTELRRMTYPTAQAIEERPMGNGDPNQEWLDASMRKFCDNEFAVYDDVNLTCAVPQDP